jgi:hypothetical protein
MLRKCNSTIFEIEHGSMGWAFHWGVKRDTKSVTCARAPRTRPDPKNPHFCPAKKSPLPPAKMCKKVRFWVKKRAFSTILCTILHKNDLFFTDIAPRYRAASPSGKNPPIYTVLNAAFSAPGPPPPVAPWWDTSSRRPPTGSRRPFCQKHEKRVFTKHRWWR